MINAQELLDFSVETYENLETYNDSVILRLCISRSYYFIYHQIIDRFYDDDRANFSSLRSDELQREVLNFFHVIKHQDIAQRISTFKRLRNKADYFLDQDVTKEDVKKSIHFAKWINNRIQKISIQSN